MPFTGSFTVTQGTDPASFTVTDTSSYADEGQGTFSGRQIFLTQDDGEPLVPPGTATDYIDFPFSGGAAKTISVLNKDYCLLITVYWLSNSPQPGSVYTATLLYPFTGNLELFNYRLTQMQTANPLLVNDGDYFDNKCLLRLYIEDAKDCVNVRNDQFGSQQLLDKGTNMKNNQNSFF